MAVAQIEIYEYPEELEALELPDLSALTATIDAEVAPVENQPVEQTHEVHAAPAGPVITELQLEEAKRRAFDEGRERGIQEGKMAEREAHAAALLSAEQRFQRQSAQLTEQFSRERERYFLAIEQEAVKLSLAIASRILRREAQMDPLMLTGAVRVALGQLANSTEVRLKVPAAELEMWAEAMNLLPNLAVKPTVVAGEGMRLGDCIVETSMGTLDLGVRSQLGEIESGFFDRVGPRPSTTTPQREIHEEARR